MKDNDMMSFKELDLGSNPATAIEMTRVEVEITSSDMVAGYARAFVKEMQRVNPRRFEVVGITEEEMMSYAAFLLKQRILCINGDCPNWRRLKRCFIPVFLQYALSMIGEVIIREKGLTFVPTMTETVDMTIDEALVVSDKIGAFERELCMVLDAMPRRREGDESVMGTALIADYVRSVRPVDHVADTYISAFLGMKLAEEQAFKVLYRIQYDDVEFIRTALTHSSAIMGHARD